MTSKPCLRATWEQLRAEADRVFGSDSDAIALLPEAVKRAELSGMTGREARHHVLALLKQLADHIEQPERRAPLQGDGYGRLQTKPPGTISWAEHLEIYEAYAKRDGRDQSAERIAERGGFGWSECVLLLGREPKTWEPRK